MATLKEIQTQVALGKVDNGLTSELSPAEFEAWKDYITQQEEDRAARIYADLQAGKTVAPADLEFFKNVIVSQEAPKQEQIVDPRTGVPSVTTVPSEPTLKVLSGAGLSKEQRKDLERKIAEIAPIAELPVDGSGRTILGNLLVKELGGGNVKVSRDGKNYMIRADKDSPFTKVPANNVMSDLARAGVQIGATAGLEFLGTTAGVALAPSTGGASLALAPAAAGLTNAAVEGLLYQQAVDRAKEYGAISGDEAILQQELINRAAGAGVLGLLFGAGGTAPKIYKAAQAAKRAGKPVNEAIEIGIRKEGGSLAAQLGQQMESFGLRGAKDVAKSTAAKGEALALQVANELKDVDAGAAGRVLRSAIDNKVAGLRESTNQAFKVADQKFAESLQKGNFSFIDVSGGLSKLEKEFAEEAAGNPEFADLQRAVLPRIRSSLNSTKAAIQEGVIPANPVTSARFFKPLAETGVPSNPGFDPRQVTAADMRKTFNILRETISDLSDGNATERLMAKKLIGLKNSIGARLGDKSIEIGVKTPYYSGIKVGAAAKDFAPYKTAFAEAKKLKEAVSPKLQRFVEGATDISQVTDTELSKKLVGIDEDLAKEAKSLIDEYEQIEPGASSIFNKSFQANVIKTKADPVAYSTEVLEAAQGLPTGRAEQTAALASGEVIPQGKVARGELSIGDIEPFSVDKVQANTIINNLRNRRGAQILLREPTESVGGEPLFLFKMRRIGGQQSVGNKSTPLRDRAVGAGVGGALGFSAGAGQALLAGEDLEKSIQKGIVTAPLAAALGAGALDVVPSATRFASRGGGRLLSSISPAVTPATTIASNLMRSPEPGPIESLVQQPSGGVPLSGIIDMAFPEGLLRTTPQDIDEDTKRILGLR